MSIPVLKPANRSNLYKPFDDKLQAVYDDCLAKGVEYWIICTTRTWAEQEEEWAKGRTVLKDANGNPQGKVTKAAPGFSPHNYSVAVDFCRNFNPGGKFTPCWATQKPEHYETLAEVAEAHGLESGLRWEFQDPPHVQLNLDKYGLTWAVLRKAHAQGGDLAVKKLLDKVAW